MLAPPRRCAYFPFLFRYVLGLFGFAVFPPRAAISRRLLAGNRFARAGPPASPPRRANAERSSAVMDAILFFPPILPASATVMVVDFMRVWYAVRGA